jgi:hypothetical protein
MDLAKMIWDTATIHLRAYEPHIGFCLDFYRTDLCHDCPSVKECLELREKEQQQQKGGIP